MANPPLLSGLRLLAPLAGVLLVSCSDAGTQHLDTPAPARSPTVTVEATEVASLESRLDETISSFEDEASCSGIVLVAEEGEVLYTSVVGMATDRAGTPVTPDSRFLIGSITKQFTAALVLKLVEEGHLDLDAHITTYLHDYPAKTGDLITLHQLLSHQSGIPNYTALPSFRPDDPQVYRPDEIVSRFSGLELDFSPGDRFEYSNSNFVVLGAILETVSGRTFAELLDRYIVERAGMRDTGYDPALAVETLVPGRTQALPPFGLRRLSSAGPANLSVAYAAGGMYSSARDLMLWERALTENRILAPEFTDLLFQEHASDPPGPGLGYGYGWSLGESYVHGALAPTPGHGGSITGFTSMIRRIPEAEGAIIVLCNVFRANPFLLTDVITRVVFR